MSESLIDLEVTDKPIIHKYRSDHCPHCHKVLEPTEGYSEHDGDLCLVICPYCHGEYVYLDDNKPRIFYYEKNDAFYLYGYDGNLYELHPIQDETIVIPEGSEGWCNPKMNYQTRVNESETSRDTEKNNDNN